MRTTCMFMAALALAVAAPPALAQSTSQLRSDLRKQEAEAGDDAAKLVELAKWAKEKGLLSEYRKLVQKVLKIDPDNEQAYLLQGYVKFDGEWMPKSKAEDLRAKALAAEMKAKGFVDVDGVWVTKDEAADAKKGIFRHDGELCSRDEKIAFNRGMVRHPITGEMISADGLAKAEDGLFPISDDRWVNESEADTYHGDTNRPWVFRTHFGTLISTIPLAQIKEMAPLVDEAVETVLPVFGRQHPTPANRPTVVLAESADVYRELGNQLGAEGSSGYGCFRAEQPTTIAGMTIQPAIAVNEPADWGPYHVRHGAALAFAAGHCVDREIEVPLWFLRGVAGLAERHYNDGVASWFGKQHLQKGGVRDLKAWFNSFEISGNLEPAQNAANVYQAGLLLAFALYGGDEDASKALEDLAAAMEKNAKAVEKAMAKLEKVLVDREDAIRTYLQKVTAK